VATLRIAERVSDATRLPLLAVPLFLIVGLAAAGVPGLSWAVLCLSLTSGLSMLYLLWLVRSGRVGDPKKISRGERTGPLWVVAGLHVGGWLLVSLLGAPPALRAVLLSYALSTLAFAILTPRLKVSLHAAGAAGATVCLVCVFGGWGALFAPVVPLVWWARRVLRRHTHAELAVGALVGGGLTAVAFALIPTAGGQA
jgi:hypothetical protein